MIRSRAFALVMSIVISSFLAAISPADAQDDLGDSISSRRFIVVDATTGEVIAERDAHDQVAIASLTKIFTTIEAIERAPLTLEITTDESDLFDASSTTMGFGPGETFTLEELLYGMMLPSGNDAAHAIARTIGFQEGDTPEESVARFVGWMNERVRNMGLRETTLVNPHGLGVPGHVSSAHDLAAFTMYALRYPVFTEIISTTSYEAGDYTVTNTNRLLSEGFTGLIGGKTGFDEDSGYCLVEVAQRSGTAMISVTLDGIAPDVWYQDNEILLDFAFDRKSERLAAGEEITGEVVSFVDPDAAVVASLVTPGASLGQSAPSTGTVAPDAVVPTPTPGAAVATEGIEDGPDWRARAAWVVAAVVMLVAVALRFAGTEERRGRPRTRSSTPRRRPATDDRPVPPSAG